MVSKSLSNPLHRAKKRKFDHDLSHVRKFSSSVGQLLPVFYDLAYPGDKYDLRTEMFTQLREIVSPAMTHVKLHLDWFFVPLEQIAVTAGDTIFGIQDFHTTLLDRNSSTRGIPVPMFNLTRLTSFLYTAAYSKSTYNDFDTFVDGVENFGAVDVFGQPVVYGIARLSQLLGFGTSLWSNGEAPFDVSKQLLLNPMFPCAYQKIFFDCYRIDNRIENDPRYYNLDKFVTSQWINNGSGDTVQVQVARFFTLRYRPWSKDLFTSCIPSPLINYGSIGMQTQSNNGESLFNFVNPLSTSYIGDNQNSVTIGNDLASFRGALAVEKLMEITRRADKNYNAQVLAHFGFEVPDGILKHVYRVGSESCVLNINEVIAQSAGSNGAESTSLGQKGGRGSAYSAPSSKGIRFRCPCHGIIMGVFSAEPTPDYTNNRLDKLNTLRTREQYWQPEFDKLGQSPLYLYELAFLPSLFNSTLHAVPVGWNWRYMESKIKLNDVNGLFMTSSVYKTWTTQRTLDSYFSNFPSNGSLHWSFFYVDPNFIDSIMLLHFHPASTDPVSNESIFARDPMLHWFKFYVHKASEISNYSTPSL